MNKADIRSASFLIVCPDNKLAELKGLFTNHFPQASIYGFASIKLDKKFIKDFQAIKQFQEADWIILSSSFATKIFLEEFAEDLDKKTKNFKPKSFASVGPSISHLLFKNKIQVELESKSLNISGLEEAFKKKEIANKKFLFVTGNKTASGSLMKALEEREGKCSQLIMYTSNTNPFVDLETYKEFSQSSTINKIICFSSPEAVDKFHQIVKKEKLQLSTNFFMACLGPSTEERAKNLFPHHQTEYALKYSYDGLIELCKRLVNCVNYETKN